MSNINLRIDESNLNNILIAHRVQGRESMNSNFSYTVQCHTLKDEIAPADIMNKKVCLTIKDSMSTDKRIIHGIVSQLRFHSTTTSSTKTYYNYEIIVESALSLLDHSVDSKVFQDKSVDKIVSAVCSEKKVDVKLGSIKAKPEYKKPYSIQYNESSGYFLSRIINEVGLFFFFKHDEHSHTLFLSDTHQDYIKMSNFNEKNLSFVSKPHYKVGPNEISVSNYNFDSANPVKTSVQKIKSFVQDSLPFHLFQDTENQKFSPEFDANLLKETMLLAQNTLMCETTDILFRPGYYFSLKSGPGFVVTNLSFFAEDTTHLSHGSSFKTRTSFKCVERIIEYRGEEIFPSPKILGPLTAKVASSGGSDPVDTDHYGCVYVKFPWDKSSNNYSLQVRVAQPWAGSNQGFQFIPHVGDEVLVSFSNGDPEHPVIVGSLYNSNNKSNFTPKDKPLVQGLVTKSNNTLLFTDDKDKEHIEIGATKDFTLTCKDSNSMSQKSFKLVSTDTVHLAAGDTALEMDKQGNLTAEVGVVKVKIDGKSGEVEVTGTKSTIIEGSLKVTSLDVESITATTMITTPLLMAPLVNGGVPMIV